MLPLLRARAAADLQRPGLPREKVVAAVVRLLEATLIRVGNEEYARQNRSFGLTTLRTSHVGVQGSKLQFRFRGKSGVHHEVEHTDRGIARIVRRMQDLPGEELFQYIDEGGEARSLESADVNAYLRDIAGEDFTSKDFRTWAGTVGAALVLFFQPAVRLQNVSRLPNHVAVLVDGSESMRLAEAPGKPSRAERAAQLDDAAVGAGAAARRRAARPRGPRPFGAPGSPRSSSGRRRRW